MGLSLKKFQYLSNGEKYEILWRKLHKKAESKQAGIQGSFSKKSQKGKIPPVIKMSGNWMFCSKDIP